VVLINNLYNCIRY